jgi:hypothetical protein
LTISAVVVAALREHGANAAVQEQGCAALRNMCANDDNKVKAGGAGALEAVVAALRAHGANAAVQEQGCRTLLRLCANDSNAVKAGGAGAIEAVVAAMCAHGANAAVQEQGCWALQNMCADNADNKTKAGASGAIQAVLAALRAHGANADVQERGCDALRIICSSNDSNAVKAGASGAIEAVVAALCAHGANAAVQERGCGALQNICANNADNKVKAAGCARCRRQRRQGSSLVHRGIERVRGGCASAHRLRRGCHRSRGHALASRCVTRLSSRGMRALALGRRPKRPQRERSSTGDRGGTRGGCRRFEDCRSTHRLASGSREPFVSARLRFCRLCSRGGTWLELAHQGVVLGTALSIPILCLVSRRL